MCLDYNNLNKVIMKNKYSIYNVVNLFDQLSKASVVTKLDLGLGYWQLWIVEGD